ncbi:hypothetical protein [Rhodobacter ferrooxidans]|uniref:Uncharacterized protein n=1 Tax=Rhodobacter ferrooxidans TaxID=371731 RepID=C8RYA3_9RHOB|nr:hypothetical protein [Rhodobacter sp. SW2]EEW26091.1 conserved hypothetical protein [Rhodobacter sp. SW2]
MGAVTIQQMADRVAGLMEERLGVKGTGLAEKLARGGRGLPRKVRNAAEDLAKFAEMAQNPRLLLQVDEAAVAEAYDICVRHLGGLAVAGRGLALAGLLPSVLGSLLVLAALVIGLLAWRGFI